MKNASFSGIPRYQVLYRIDQLAQELLREGTQQRERPVIVEIGSGSGFLSYLLAKFFNVKVIAIDPNADLIDKAKRVYETEINTPSDPKKIQFIVGDAESARSQLESMGIIEPEVVLNSSILFRSQFGPTNKKYWR